MGLHFFEKYGNLKRALVGRKKRVIEGLLGNGELPYKKVSMKKGRRGAPGRRMVPDHIRMSDGSDDEAADSKFNKGNHSDNSKSFYEF